MRRSAPVATIALTLATISASQPAAAQISLGVSIRVGTPPPPLPVYVQPPLPGVGYIWVPGYWAWDDYVSDYYWVAGYWELAPRPGYLWTPAWWGWDGGNYVFHSGYWGPRVGFYGGIAYGFGYTGYGYWGGAWRGNQFYYNRSVTNVTNVNVTNVYEQRIDNRVTRVSYNGGQGGLQAQPTAAERAAQAGPRLPATARQQAVVAAARANPQAFASRNAGRPPVHLTALPVANPAAIKAPPSAGRPPAPRLPGYAPQSDQGYGRQVERGGNGGLRAPAAPQVSGYRAPPVPHGEGNGMPPAQHSGHGGTPGQREAGFAPPPPHAVQPHGGRPQGGGQPHGGGGKPHGGGGKPHGGGGKRR